MLFSLCIRHPLGHTSAAYQTLVRQHGITMSMSDVGKCYDNASMESLWATLKTELTHHRTDDSIASLRRDLLEYIEFFIIANGCIRG